MVGEQQERFKQVRLLHDHAGDLLVDGELDLRHLSQPGRRQAGQNILPFCKLSSCFKIFSKVFRIRCEFLRNVLRQDISWYDTNTATDFASRMTE